MPETTGSGKNVQPAVAASVDVTAKDFSALELPFGMNPAGTVNFRHATKSLRRRFGRLRARLEECLETCRAHPDNALSIELLEAERVLKAALTDASSQIRELAQLPISNEGRHDGQLRVLVVSAAYAERCEAFSLETFKVFLDQAQSQERLRFNEIMQLPVSLKIAYLENVLNGIEPSVHGHGTLSVREQSSISGSLSSLRRVNRIDWSDVLETFVPFRPILSRDPFQIFNRMDLDTRMRYLNRIASLASVSDSDEFIAAEIAVSMAEEAAKENEPNHRIHRRKSHVGYYLFEQGFQEYSQSIGYHPGFKARVKDWLLQHNETVYIYSITILSTLIVAACIAPLVPHHPFWPVMATLIVALIPATQGANDFVNNLLTSFLPPRVLPKMDYSAGIPTEATTLVAVPTLLLDEEQVLDLFRDIEARWLANRDRNLHFALVTDLPDSKIRPADDDQSELIDLAISMTNVLNERYAGQGGGAFLLLHRRRVYNARQGVWMGWERKRGKLLDLNKLLCGTYDAFPVKAGPVDVLRFVMFVLTLDSDTQLPHESAERLVGTLHHPLNQAIVDPMRQIVTRGYGILQPRVSVSVASASRSRLASIYSGETGFDIYTTAVSDVYQDLFGEAIFTGKGIYEVRILHEVLEGRFPRNTLLSHDLIEGAYARVGLVSDVEVVDDYPTHYAAHSRRRHRWVRGDWQILRWLSWIVPNEKGMLIANPISFISQWKIIDNLRRSLLEPVTFLLLVAGWLFLPGGPIYWTSLTLFLSFMPVFVQLVVIVATAAVDGRYSGILDRLGGVARTVGFHFLALIFLAEQTLLLLDAIVRSLVRSGLTLERQLEWETAAQAERGQKGQLSLYLRLSPVIALSLCIAMLLRRDWHGLLVASPILALWTIAPLISRWLDRAPSEHAPKLAADERAFLYAKALMTWRYYYDFGGAANRWLIPDNVEEAGVRRMNTLSPTNLGMLLNARQAALQLGFLTLPEFLQATLGTLETYDSLEKWQGHIHNWIDIGTLNPLPPFVISTVDSGNLAASLFALHGGALELMSLPVLNSEVFEFFAKTLGHDRKPTEEMEEDPSGVVRWFLEIELPLATASWVAWYTHELHRQARTFIETCLPWLLPEFEGLRSILQGEDLPGTLVPRLEEMEEVIERFDGRLREHTENPEARGSIVELQGRMSSAKQMVHEYQVQLQRVADLAKWHGNAMRFDQLLSSERHLLSVSYDTATGQLSEACYDVLASESRLATFFAIAKGDIPQRTWGKLGRAHVRVKKHVGLLSWSGTMFEYLMPTLWVRHFPNTLMMSAIRSAINIQMEQVRDKPWGISESGRAVRDDHGRYGYFAWGIPELALKFGAKKGVVISPYSTFLALPFARRDALRNVRWMEQLGWYGEYGFYEAADYSETPGTPVLVRSWMAHHQGMTLLAITNVLHEGAFQRWFHSNAQIRAAELFLHEKPLSAPIRRHVEQAHS